MWWCCAPRVRVARSQYASFFYADGVRREHVHCEVQRRSSAVTLLPMRSTAPGRSVGVDGGFS